ncbi:MAG: hypothetical protein CMD18_00775 [Flavobacteriales bacterium]|nr:hypothetical protein [Flavobacteriales bacterium]|tara:strand:+ start:2417 stop:2815 length:399 start_codon:yes stop_codon:yes gene_type:complete
MKEKRKNQKNLTSFFILLSSLLLVVFSCHVLVKYLLDETVFSNRITESYLLNFFLGFLSYVVLILSIKKHLSSLGFIFMYTSFGKFVVFFIAFKPYYSANGTVDFDEFMTLMIPYSFALVAEIYSMSKVLKN